MHQYFDVLPEVIWTSEDSEVINIPEDVPLYQDFDLELAQQDYGEDILNNT